MLVIPLEAVHNKFIIVVRISIALFFMFDNTIKN